MAKTKTVDFVHVGPGTQAGSFLRRFWHPVYVAGELERGWAKRVEVLGEHVTLYRGETGDAHVVQDRCPHRNTQLSLGWIEDDSIRCFYHGWKFGHDGSCLEQPCERENFAGKVSIRSYPTREYLGLVFAYLGDGEPPPLPRFPELDEENGDPLQVRAVTLPFNYFQRLENSLDEAHVHFVHKVSADLTSELRIPPNEFEAEETDYGILRKGIRERGDGKDTRYSHFFIPNCNLLVVPPSTPDDDWAAHLTWRVPIDDVTTMSYMVERRQPAPRRAAGKDGKPFPSVDEATRAILAGDMRIQDVDPDHPMLFNIQDGVAMAGQGQLYLREDERLGRSDVGVILLRRIYEREIGRLEAGQDLKQWGRPAGRVMLGFKPAADALPPGEQHHEGGQA